MSCKYDIKELCIIFITHYSSLHSLQEWRLGGEEMTYRKGTEAATGGVL